MIETCRTQEFAYISSFEVDKKTPDGSPSSSTDRITVINNQDDFSKTCKEFEKRLLLTHDLLTKNIIQRNINQCKVPRNNVKALVKPGPKDNKQLTPMRKKKINHLSPRVDQHSKSVTTTNNSSECRDSLLGISLKPSDNSDFKTADGTLSPGKGGSFVGSDNSRSSKAESLKTAEPDSSNGKY